MILMKIAIIEDEQIHSQVLSEYIRKWGRERKTALAVRAFQTAEEFLFHWQEEAYDILLIDIQMPGMNGMDMAKKIRQKDKETDFIFTTGITDYIAEGYEVSAAHYLIKPVQEGRLYDCLDRLAAKQREKAYILLHTMQEEVVKLPASAINYAEARGHYAVIKPAYKELLEVKESLSELERMLGQEFIKCHRSYLCRVGSICRIEKDSILFDDNSRIPVSRRMHQQVNQAFIRHFSRRDEK